MAQRQSPELPAPSQPWPWSHTASTGAVIAVTIVETAAADQTDLGVAPQGGPPPGPARAVFMAGTTETPVLDLLASMTAESIEAADLDAETLMLVRIAALVAVDAPPR